jgi:UDP-3-O-[3-hydroxymyristoyl] glucosamine N-acyltransferase
MKAREIAEFLSAELSGDGDIEIESVADAATATAGQLAFLERPADAVETGASCLIVPPNLPLTASAPAIISAEEPKLAFARIAAKLHPRKMREGGKHPSANISPDARIGEGVFIGAFVCVGDGSEIGDGTELRAGAMVGDNVRIGMRCVIHPNVVVCDGCLLGDDVILHSGVVIGADGFGYVRDRDGYVKFPQIGIVVVEDHVEIGANTCVDRGALGETRIGEGTKIDNLVQVAHNVRIGKRVVIAAQTGISGSTVIEDDCVIGGQVGFGDHAVVKSGAVIGSQAGVLPGKIVRPGVWWGTPVQPLDEYKRQNAYVKSLGRLRETLREIERRLGELEGNSRK